ncbi:MAG: UDP-2,4-diacetamido-2,4,6-trideoxy-beta-L-altropyranose hydrolase [Bacteroidia bacterium]
MDKLRVLFRTDGGTSIGMGHVSRCIALADMLKNNFKITFAIQETAESILNSIQTVTKEIIMLPQTNNYTEDSIKFSQYLKADDIVVLDGYKFKTDYQKTIKEKKCKLICIDDLHAWHFAADAVINHADEIDTSVYSTEPYTKFYLGLDYVLLRKPFLESTDTQRKINEVKKVFISMGAADENNLTQKFTEALLKIKKIEEINLLLSSINPNLRSIENIIHENKQANIVKHFDIGAEELKELIQTCDIAICPASTISLECCAVGIGLISGFTSDNQMGILSGLRKNKVAIDFGDMNILSVDDIKNELEKIISETNAINEMVNNQRKMIDGKSPERLINVFKRFENEKLHFRFAEEADVSLFFQWANDPLVRKNSYNQNLVLYDYHVKWFHLKLVSGECKFYLFFDEQDNPVGQVRMEKSENEIVVGISVDKNFRGKSYGVQMLEAATNDYLKSNPESTIAAYIKIENASSYNIFLKVGFTNEEIVTIHGNKSYKLYKTLI